MELEQFQVRALKQVGAFVGELAVQKAKADKVRALDADIDVNFAEQAWRKAGIAGTYKSRSDGLGRHLPHFCMKIPTGGGKTLLGIKITDLVNLHYRQRKNGLVIWIVPSTQIYNQTLQSLRNKDHPYRQHLDNMTGGRVMIVEKLERLTPLDMQENLVVLMLMLPAANRQNRETLKMFQDAGYAEFFPADDATTEHEALMQAVPNLDCFGDKDGFFGRRVKTSLGNVLRLQNPLIILDEGHKAYTDNAQATLAGFNPCMIVELSATPKAENSNILCNVSGRELEQEDMLKLDLHLFNDASWLWKDTLRKAREKRDMLEQIARTYESERGRYIRPIMLVQVERTGKEARDDSRYTHAEQIKDYLIQQGVPASDIAIKSSERDDLKEIDDDDGLMSRDVPVRYIITKQALQEGWDCPFAYVLAILTNIGAATALTQLVGRILRQPGARKTGVKALDESYVYAYQQNPNQCLADIKKGFEVEGLGDLSGRVATEGGGGGDRADTQPTKIRDKFKGIVESAFLPVFACREDKSWRQVSYAMDIETRIDWGKLNLKPFYDLNLSDNLAAGEAITVGLGATSDDLASTREREAIQTSQQIDPAYLARVLGDELIPNPWIAYAVTENLLAAFEKRHGRAAVTANFIYIVDEAKKYLVKEKNRLAEKVFRELLAADEIRLVIIANEESFGWFRDHKIRKAPALANRYNQPLQKSMFDTLLADSFNDTERDVAWFLEEQEQLFYWWRNPDRRGYYLQGWEKGRIYPDFIFGTGASGEGDQKLYVVETKGIHLKNENTDYKKAVFKIANEKSNAIEVQEADLHHRAKVRPVQFSIIYSDEWRNKLQGLLAE